MWKEGRVLANLKEERSNMKAAMCQTVARHFYECFPCPYNLGGGQLLPLTGEEIGLVHVTKCSELTFLLLENAYFGSSNVVTRTLSFL